MRDDVELTQLCGDLWKAQSHDVLLDIITTPSDRANLSEHLFQIIKTPWWTQETTMRRHVGIITPLPSVIGRTIERSVKEQWTLASKYHPP